MYCTKCGRELPADGSPCVCEQTSPAVQPETAATYEQPEAPVEAAPEAPAAPVYEQPQQPVYEQQPEQPAYEQQPVYQQPVYQPQPQPTYAPMGAMPITPVHGAVRAVISSPIFLIAVICTTVAFLLSAAASLLPNTMSSMVSYLPREALYAIQSAGIDPNTLGSSVGFGSATGLLPIIALWMLYVSAKGKAPVMSSAGFTFLHVLMIIGIVGICFLGVACVVVGVVGAVSVSDYASGSEYGMMGAILFGVALAAIAVVAFLIVYYLKICRTLKAGKMALATGVFHKTGSMFVCVCNFIVAAYYIIDLYGTFVLNGPLVGVSNLCNAAALVLFSLCIMHFNKAHRAMQQPASAYQPPYNG